eukprot:scaffold11973_cov112-Isochrysis_galbana.AAC.4
MPPMAAGVAAAVDRISTRIWSACSACACASSSAVATLSNGSRRRSLRGANNRRAASWESCRKSMPYSSGGFISSVAGGCSSPTSHSTTWIGAIGWLSSSCTRWVSASVCGVAPRTARARLNTCGTCHTCRGTGSTARLTRPSTSSAVLAACAIEYTPALAAQLGASQYRWQASRQTPLHVCSSRRGNTHVAQPKASHSGLPAAPCCASGRVAP